MSEIAYIKLGKNTYFPASGPSGSYPSEESACFPTLIFFYKHHIFMKTVSREIIRAFDCAPNQQNLWGDLAEIKLIIDLSVCYHNTYEEGGRPRDPVVEFMTMFLFIGFKQSILKFAHSVMPYWV
jgi:hypothetical protein